MHTTLEKLPATEKPRFDTEAIGESQGERSSLRGSWPWGLDNIQQWLTVYKDHEREVFISAFRWCVDGDHPMHLKDFAARVKINDTTLNKIYRGKYCYQDEVIERDKLGRELSRKPHPKAGQLCPLPEGLVGRIENFLMLEAKRFALGDNVLVRTPMVQGITDYCETIREVQQMGWIVGPSHIGKTWALEYDYAPSHNHGRTVYVRMPAGAGRREVFAAIWYAMSKSSTKGSVDELKFKIKNGLTKDMLLILDEMHLLYHHGKFFKILDEIRELHDLKKVGVVLVFTWLPDDMKAAKDKELQQVFRRAPRKLYLPKMPAKEDLEAILDQNGLAFPKTDELVTIRDEGIENGKITKVVINEKPYDLLRQLAKDEGLLAITERIRAGKQLAKAARKPMAWQYFVEAHLEIKAQGEAEEGW